MKRVNTVVNARNLPKPVINKTYFDYFICIKKIIYSEETLRLDTIDN